MSAAAARTSTAARATVLTSLPISLAWRSAGFRWAQGDMPAEFSCIAPLLLGSLLLCVVLLFLLLAVHGRAEVRKLWSKRHANATLPGIFSALTFVLENFALANGLSATSVVLLNKFAILPGVLGEIWLTRTTPYRTQLATMAALILCIIVCSLGDDGEPNMSLVGLLLGLGAALSDGVGNIAFEATAQSRLDDLEEDSGAETLRCFLVNELCKSVFNIVLMLVFERKHLSQGFFNGWGLPMLVGGVMPLPAMVALYNTAILTAGSLTTRMAASADIGIAYLMDALIFGDTVRISQGLLILAIIALIGVYTKFAVDVRKAAADALIRSEMLVVDVVCRV
ncbi:unnamed protein product [Prorocentrum cordatum]|uniref:Sugar phosphate transporter domain-containing protein n=1 Tax=Prorocentrum cordatum TaxID=2364126 RepID=A0ABN9UMY6_9DINO|nr:unnamed protein product [Polarella glacialis]